MINPNLKIRQLRLDVLNKFSWQHPVATPEQIDDVIVLLGSSRSGSSLLYQILSQHPVINSLPGEDITYFRLHDYQKVDHFSQDDRLHNIVIDYPELARTILTDAGTIELKQSPNTFEKVNRFILQWPMHAHNPDYLFSVFDSTKNYEEGINKIGVNLNLYENYLLNKTIEFDIERSFIEEPPFLFPKSRSFKNKKRNILILKSSSNSYRMDHIKNLFPKANYHYFLIKRKPEGAINGLMDGWNSSGFHSHFLGHLTELNIDLYPSKNWWKFDLPPNWQKFTNSTLPEVCAFQWSSAYQFILKFLANKNFATIEYEDFFTPDIAFLKINHFLNSINLSPLPVETFFPEIMTTNKPSLDRWREKEDLIMPVVEQSYVKDIYHELLDKTAS